MWIMYLLIGLGVWVLLLALILAMFNVARAPEGHILDKTGEPR